MKNLHFLLLAFGMWQLSSCEQPSNFSQQITSPDGQISLQFDLDAVGAPIYWVSYNSQIVIDTSTFGFSFVDMPNLGAGLKITSVQKNNFSETWQPVWGTDSEIKNEYNQLTISFKEQQAPNRRFDIVFRVFDDGVAFRYVFPQQDGWTEALIKEENTTFNLAGDHTCWWQPGDWDIYEHLYQETPLSKIDCTPHLGHTNLAQTSIPNVHAVNTPLTMRTAEGLYLSLHEAALYDFSAITLESDRQNFGFKTILVGGPNEWKTKRSLPFETSWRTISIAPTAAKLLATHLIENLNEPNKIKETDWIKPTKYMGIWWEMHLDKSSWGMAGGKHGATTANAKRYIDFASSHGIPALLIEGWNTGWEQWLSDADREGIFDFVTPYPDFDLPGVVKYGKEKGVEIIGHHETSAAVLTYEQQLDTAFILYNGLGIGAVKTGYVGKLSPKGEYHQGQWMVNHYQHVLEEAAKYKTMVDAHETIKDTGIRRTWPNFMAREVMRGQEFNAWSREGSNYPNHVLILPFTIGLNAPLDYTPGAFNLTLTPYKPNNYVPHTLAKELALYVLIYSPIQMACDLPEHYERNLPAFQFIKDVPTDWQRTLIIDAEPAQHLTIARQAKDADRWYIGTATNESPRTQTIPLDFLTEGKTYTARLYTDTPQSHWKDNPQAILIRSQPVAKGDTLKLALAPGGGAAISIE